MFRVPPNALSQVCKKPHSNWPHWFCWCLQPNWSWTVAASDRHVFLSEAYGLRSLSWSRIMGYNCCDSAVWHTNICDVKNANWDREREDTIVLIFQIQLIQTYLSSKRFRVLPASFWEAESQQRNNLGQLGNHFSYYLHLLTINLPWVSQKQLPGA